MSEYSIRNSVYELTVSSHGAEIRSLKKNGRELMWHADPKYWGRTSPILFPLVGNYWEKKSRFEGKTYEMSQHGFARDMEFTLVSQLEDELVFELRDDEKTLSHYPFKFVLLLGYKLSESGVEVSWKVQNPSEREMFFSIGGHPAFNCNLETDGIIFMKDGKKLEGGIKSHVIAGDGSGCISDEWRDYSLEEGVLKLSPELFDDDALVIENRQADAVTILDSEGRDIVSVSFDVPLFGVWSPDHKNAPFVCIEPWCGRCDRVGFTGDLSEREYGNRLGAGEEFATFYTIR